MQWVKFGWGINMSQEFSPTSIYYVDFSDVGEPSQTPVDVAITTVKSISMSHPAPYYLMVSGGADSQSMLWAWHCANVPFHAVSFKFVNDLGECLNSKDLIQLEEFAAKNNIAVDYREFNIINFLENELEEFAIRYQCTSPQLTAHMKMSEELVGGTVIYSGNFESHSRAYKYTNYGMKRYAETSGRSIVPFFFLHDRDIAGSINFIAENATAVDVPYDHIPDEYNGNFHDAKCYISNIKKTRVLLKHGYKIIPQPIKMTGFEEIKDLYDSCDISTQEKLKFGGKLSNRPFDIIFRYRLESKIKYKNKVITKIKQASA